MTAPNPPAVPDMWWSPTHGATFYRGGKFYYRMSINPPHLDELPADTVRLVPEVFPPLDMDRDAAIEAAMEAGRIDRLPEYDDQIAEAVAAGVHAALDYLSSQTYPIRLGPRATEETT